METTIQFAMASKDWTTKHIRKKVSVTGSACRQTDHMAELQVIVGAMNTVGVGSRQAQEIKKVVNDKANLKSRGKVANADKGQAITRVLKRGYAKTKVEKGAVAQVRYGG